MGENEDGNNCEMVDIDSKILHQFAACISSSSHIARLNVLITVDVLVSSRRFSILALDCLCLCILSHIVYIWLTSSHTTESAIMGISRDSRHKRSASGAKRAHYRA